MFDVFIGLSLNTVQRFFQILLAIKCTGYDAYQGIIICFHHVNDIHFRID